MIIYIILLTSFILLLILSSLFIYLTFNKFIRRFLDKKKINYRSKIYPLLNLYISTDSQYINRVFYTKKKWKREIIIDILYEKILATKNQDMLDSINRIYKELGLIDELASNLKDKRWWIVAENTRKVGNLKIIELVPIIYKNLHSTNYDVWTSSARALSKMGKNSLLIEFLLENDGSLKRWSVIRIGDMLDDEGEGDLDLMLDSLEEASPLLKGIFIETIGKRKAVKALPIIELYLDSDDVEIRIKALKAIGDIGLTTQEDKILTLMYSDNWIEKVMAIRIVKNSSLQRAIPTLEKLLTNSNWWIRLRAAEALYSFGTIGIERLEQIREKHDDPYARDMAKKVLQDKEFEVVFS